MRTLNTKELIASHCYESNEEGDRVLVCSNPVFSHAPLALPHDRPSCFKQFVYLRHVQ